ncbi:unnamed protein product [Rotaria sp. Silwood1]|nr:unnamed protein product [Rotaria sp. Silwood1]CAF1632854.1 unnamed protein product [Rotaria sp. Silwood1]CAF3746803.1 unnamed protein product [Rotaria sp. Silwood1]CAF3783813.1 unnamed protein product [Rotaria sp. Silwood1]CAF3784313.1 unnamed protein product [Rotaria sp. Silwood1]
MSILFLSVYSQIKIKQDDDLCPKIIGILCVKNVLLDIARTADEINIIAHKMEQDISEYEPTPMTLNDYINDKMKHIQSSKPKSYYHEQFMNIQNNINKTDFLHLLQEEYYAFSYLYNSIQRILKIGNLFSTSMDESFEEILNNLQKNILCKYRSIFNVYSELWLPIDKIHGMEILISRKRNAPSFLYNAYSMIIIRLLYEWIENVNNIASNIDSKYFR